VAITLNAFRNGAVGFIEWLDRCAIAQRCSASFPASHRMISLATDPTHDIRVDQPNQIPIAWFEMPLVLRNYMTQ
jgi:hypothetical protein